MATPSFTTGLWALAPLQRTNLPDNQSLLIRSDDGSICMLADSWLPALNLLTTFRTLAQHLELLSRAIPLARGAQDSPSDFLLKLHRSGLLVSGQALIRPWLRPATLSPVDVAPLRVAVITCDRPFVLKRLLESLVVNERQSASRWSYEIVDDSRQTASIVANQSLLNEFRDRLELHYHGRQEQQAFLDGLTAALPQARTQLRWLLDGRDPEHQGQASYGCPKNYLLLRFAGSRLILIDDDALMRAWIHPKATGAFCFADVSEKREIALDTETLTSALRPLEEDPIGAHARLLGRPLADALRSSGSAASVEELLGHATPAHLADIRSAGPRIRATLNAIVGDPGTSFDLSLLFRDPLPLQLAGDADAYRRLMASPRTVFTGGPWWTLTNRGYFLLATMAGVDFSPYTPPLMPVGRNEDAMIGFLLKFLYPEDLQTIAPWALEHCPAPPRPWRVIPQGPALDYSPATAWCSWAASTGLAGLAGDPNEKMARLQEQFLALSSLDSGLRQIAGKLVAARRRTWALLYAQLNHSYRENRLVGAGWRTDVERAIRELKLLLQAPPARDQAAILRQVTICRRYFLALKAWDGAQELVRRGGAGIQSLP